MPAVDSLLRLMQSQNADALSLSTAGVAKLSRAGAAQPLSMPPVAQSMIELFAGEVLSAEQLDVARREGSVHADYGDAVVHAKFGEGGWSLLFKKRTGKATAPAKTLPAPSPPLERMTAASAASSSASGDSSRSAVASAGTASTSAPGWSSAPVEPGQLDDWLRRAVNSEASDLLVAADEPPRLRHDGALSTIDGTIDEATLRASLALTGQQEEVLARTGSLDFALTRAGVRFRVNVFRHAGGLAAAFRPVRTSVPTLASLDLPASLRRLVEFQDGLVLVVGPTGAGKSTTLVALVEELNRSAAKHIVTLEDPIEYAYRSQRSMIHQRELGTHVDSFASGLRAALRESPDVILLGEMRDPETIAAALTAAETGHLVLSSLHAGSAAMAVERIVDAFPDSGQRQVRAQLAGTLRAVMTQKLLPRVGGGRVPVHELLLGTAAAATLIREDKTHQLESVIQTGREDGMMTMERSIAERVGRGELRRPG